MNISEARAVNTVVSYLTKSAAANAATGIEDKVDARPYPTKRQAREALAVLTERAHDTLMAKTKGYPPAARKARAGATGDDVRKGWK